LLARAAAKQVCCLQPLIKTILLSASTDRTQIQCGTTVLLGGGLATGQWPEKNKWSLNLKRLKLRKINMSDDAKGDSRAGKPAPLSSVEAAVLRSLGRLEQTLLILCTLQTQEQFPRGSVSMRF
jgi:hypothetical protein